MQAPKSPCIGICSTTSLGDLVCRGCKRYAFEVVNWNSYDDDAKAAVLNRVEQFTVRILEPRLEILSTEALEQGLRHFGIPFDRSLSPYCWLHVLLKRGGDRIECLEDYGAAPREGFREQSLAVLRERIDDDLLALASAHFHRYINIDRRLAAAEGDGKPAKAPAAAAQAANEPDLLSGTD